MYTTEPCIKPSEQSGKTNIKKKEKKKFCPPSALNSFWNSQYYYKLKAVREFYGKGCHFYQNMTKYEHGIL